MATFKKEGQCNLVRKGQLWRNEQNNRVGTIVAKGKGGKQWIMLIGKKTHHVNEGTLLKLFSLL